MKFRGKIEDITLLNTIVRLVNTFCKQHDEIVLRLNESQMMFISKEIKGGLQLYARFPARFVFVEYCCEGVCPEANEIYVSLDSEKFLRTLKQINKYSKSVKLKLTQKNRSSFIEIVIEQSPNPGSENINVSHDIPIEVLSRKEWTFYEEFQVEESEDIFYLPPLGHIRNVIDKQKNFDRYLTIILSNDTLTIKARHALCEVATFYDNIEFKEPYDDREVMKTIEVDSSRLSMFLNSLQNNPIMKIETNLVEQQLINLKFTCDHINVSFTLPHMLNA